MFVNKLIIIYCQLTTTSLQLFALEFNVTIMVPAVYRKT